MWDGGIKMKFPGTDLDNFSDYVLYRSISNKICEWIFEKAVEYNKYKMEKYYKEINEKARKFYEQYGTYCPHCDNVIPAELYFCPVCNAQMHVYDAFIHDHKTVEKITKFRQYFNTWDEGKKYLYNLRLITKEELDNDRPYNERQIAE